MAKKIKGIKRGKGRPKGTSGIFRYQDWNKEPLRTSDFNKIKSWMIKHPEILSDLINKYHLCILSQEEFQRYFKLKKAFPLKFECKCGRCYKISNLND